MIKLNSIKIKNFKNIKIANISLKNFNVLVGPNNSGKSNFIQILSFLNFIINGVVDDIEDSFKNGYFKNTFGYIEPQTIKSSKGEIEIKLKFSNSDIKTVYTYHLILLWEKDEKREYGNKFRIKKEILDYKESNKPGKAISIFNRNNDDIRFGADFTKTKIIEKIPYFASVIRFLSIIPEKNNPYFNAIDCLNFLLKTPTFYFSNIELSKLGSKERMSHFRGRTIAFDIESEISELDKSPKMNIFKSILKSALNITEINVIKTISSEDKKDTNYMEYVYMTHLNSFKHIFELSDGSVLLIALITKLLTSPYILFLVEEPENSLHPKALVDLIKFMRSFEEEKQFIIATHSITIINEVEPEDVIIAQIDENGNSDISRVSDIKELKKKLKSGYIDFSERIFFELNINEEFEEVK
jgi:predicted ATPase